MASSSRKIGLCVAVPMAFTLLCAPATLVFGFSTQDRRLSAQRVGDRVSNWQLGGGDIYGPTRLFVAGKDEGDSFVAPLSFERSNGASAEEISSFESSFGSMEGEMQATGGNMRRKNSRISSLKLHIEDDSPYKKVVESAIIATPAIMATMAFTYYKETSTAFHKLVDAASKHTWAPVDGGAYLSDLLTPALNGPVTTSISILFGTLVSMTVSTLYQRQSVLARALSDLVDEVRVAELYIDCLPDPYRTRAYGLLESFISAIFRDAATGELEPESLRKRKELGALLTLLSRLSLDPEHADKRLGHVIDKACGTVDKIISHRSLLIVTYENRFPIWHYGNLAVLASTICLIFLILTDKAALLFLGGFQLRMCWAMLIGTFSMLGVVLYDLDTPLSGVFQIVKTSNMNGYSMSEYADVLSGLKKKKSK